MNKNTENKVVKGIVSAVKQIVAVAIVAGGAYAAQASDMCGNTGHGAATVAARGSASGHRVMGH